MLTLLMHPLIPSSLSGQLGMHSQWSFGCMIVGIALSFLAPSPAEYSFQVPSIDGWTEESDALCSPNDATTFFAVPDFLPRTNQYVRRDFRFPSSSSPPISWLICSASSVRPRSVPRPSGGLYFAKTYSAKSKNQYRNVVNRTLPNQEYAKPESAKTYSGIC